MASDKQWLAAEEISDAYRKIRLATFLAVVISTVSVISAVIALPLLYSFIQGLQSHIGNEMAFCRYRSREMWSEMTKIRPNPIHNRLRREWQFGQWNSGAGPIAPPKQVGPSAYGGGNGNNYGGKPPASGPRGYSSILPAVDIIRGDECCTCQQGPAGPPGLPGPPGQDGTDGKNGTDGKPGKDGVVKPPSGPPPTACQTCPPGPAGPAGQKGVKGGPGPKGAVGEEGSKGTPGKRGPAGERGPPGEKGGLGPKGPPGAPGKSIEKPGPDGPSGSQGPMGPPGPVGSVGLDGRPGEPGGPGEAGDAGDPGIDGKNGSPGPKGPPGPRGPPGGCSHCPPARTAPGYSQVKLTARN